MRRPLRVMRVPTLGRSVRPAGDLRALSSLAGAIREYRPDLIHTPTAKAGTVGRIAAAMCHVPMRVHTFHGHLLHGYFSPTKTAIVVRAERQLARMTHALVAVGDRSPLQLIEGGRI